MYNFVLKSSDSNSSSKEEWSKNESNLAPSNNIFDDIIVEEDDQCLLPNLGMNKYKSELVRLNFGNSSNFYNK